MEPQEKKAFELQLALACQLGEVMGRLRERRIASQREPGRNTPPEMLARAAAFNDSMRARELATLEAVQHESWWDAAQQHDVCNMLALSSTWKNVSDAAATMDAHIRGQLASRFGISADVLAYTLPSSDEYRHIPDPPTPQDEPDLLPQKQPAETPTASADRSAATQPAAPAPETDEDLTAALRAHREAWSEYTADSVRHRGQQVASGEERFLAAVDAKRGQELLAAIRSLRAEARRVPDPGGPLGNYAEALSAWADNHPEIDSRELQHITHELLWANR